MIRLTIIMDVANAPGKSGRVLVWNVSTMSMMVAARIIAPGIRSMQ